VGDGIEERRIEVLNIVLLEGLKKEAVDPLTTFDPTNHWKIETNMYEQ
jgi:hypothetical protein